MPLGLGAIDRLLDDPVFFEPFVPHFDLEIGRPSIATETHLRMVFLRFRYRLGFETLCKEVTDLLDWRRFCQIGITDRARPSERRRSRQNPVTCSDSRS